MEFSVIKAEQPIIKVNFDEVKDSLIASLKDYQNIVVTEETLAGCKQAQKELASLRVEVDNQRKKIKKELSSPIIKFEEQCKELITMIEKVEAPLKDGIKVFDDVRREEKRQIAIAIIMEEAEAAGLNDRYKAMVEIKDKYMNLTAKESDVREDVQAQTMALKVQQNADEERILIIEDAIARENERLNKKLSIDDFNYEITHGRSTSEILGLVKSRAQFVYDAENMKKEEVKEEAKPEVKPEVKEEVKDEKIYSVTFKLTGNADEMRKVSSFLKENGINYQLLEQKVIK